MTTPTTATWTLITDVPLIENRATTRVLAAGSYPKFAAAADQILGSIGVADRIAAYHVADTATRTQIRQLADDYTIVAIGDDSMSSERWRTLLLKASTVLRERVDEALEEWADCIDDTFRDNLADLRTVTASTEREGDNLDLTRVALAFTTPRLHLAWQILYLDIADLQTLADLYFELTTAPDWSIQALHWGERDARRGNQTPDSGQK